MKIIDLFAGIGGIRLGMEQAGKELGIEIENVFSSEINKYSIETYKANFNDEEIKGDIMEISEKEIPNFDILLAGFPCQPFSQAGKQKGLDDPRGQLFFEIIRIIKAKKPKAFLLENVKRLKTHDNGKTLELMLEELKKIGYKNLHFEVLRAKDFGVPQNRERLFIVGFKDGKKKFEFPDPVKTKVKVGNILEKKVDDKYTISDKLWEGHQRRKTENSLKGKGFGYTLFNKNSEYTNTISARYYKDGSEILIEQKGKNPRKLTPREAARLQGFPDEFKIPVSDVQAYKQFGNSVTVPVIKEISLKILNSLKNRTK